MSNFVVGEEVMNSQLGELDPPSVHHVRGVLSAVLILILILILWQSRPTLSPPFIGAQ
jgi:hypothetical protein